MGALIHSSRQSFVYLNVSQQTDKKRLPHRGTLLVKGQRSMKRVLTTPLPGGRGWQGLNPGLNEIVSSICASLIG